MLSTGRTLIPVLFSFILVSCATPTLTSLQQSQSTDDCRTLFQSVDYMVLKGGVRDAEASILKDFPYLRINRFYASFKEQLNSDNDYHIWIKKLADLDEQARSIEIRNLPDTYQARLGKEILPRVNRCRSELIRKEASTLRAKIIEQATVPDGYISWQRLLGIYPISSLFVSAGVNNWHQEVKESYARPLDKLPVSGSLKRWSSRQSNTLSPVDIRKILSTSEDSLGIPRPSTNQLNQLFQTFAPIWEIDVVDTNDKIGEPSRVDGLLTVDTEKPVEYHKLSYTRYQNQTLFQLNYIIWFPERASNDMYGGKIDGIIWRVTIGSDGSIWMYDSIHNCGCYHKFYPNPMFRLRSDLHTSYFEPPLSPQSAPGSNPVTLRVSHLTHYIERVRHESSPPPFIQMNSMAYDSLRSLKTPAGHQSMFDERGLVIESKRDERYILWPTGVPSPGAMRQWGNHITAFVGSRYFDDPHLIESLFERVTP